MLWAVSDKPHGLNGFLSDNGWTKAYCQYGTVGPGD